MDSGYNPGLRHRHAYCVVGKMQTVSTTMSTMSFERNNTCGLIVQLAINNHSTSVGIAIRTHFG